MYEQNYPTPINVLPREILLRIFSILIGWDTIYRGYWDSQRLWDHDRRACQHRSRHVTNLSCVNTLWRRLVINTTSFWSHIDIFFEHGHWLPLGRFSRQCFTRVKDAPIELHINCGQTHRLYTAASAIPNYLRDRTVTSLILTTLYPAVVEPIVGIYLNGNTRSHLSKLQVELVSSMESVVCVPIPTHANQEQLSQNLLQLNTLRLSATTVDWDSARFSRLVDLQLHDVQPSPSMDQIYDILTASPELCTIELEQLHLKSYELTGRPKARIHLPKLTFLSLGGSDFEFVDRLLQVIGLDASPLCLKLWISETSYKALESLRIPHKLTTLSLRIPDLPIAILGQMMTSQNDLTTLALADQDVDDFNVVPNTIGSQHSNLQRVVLRKCRITFMGLRRIASIPSLRSLWIESCMYAPRMIGFYSRELPEDELKWLEVTVHDLYVDYAHYGRLRCSLPWWLQ
ncbi:unnamed protein product [Rhizoctonia solani]|uniref:F-box domain-containing protein n=1 Tax=Rhizoctonia solani TaxID=456999 RepID=A0A8H2Y2T6_9AGAM|nr:unnamed protein product [Rhizoctonia solani]